MRFLALFLLVPLAAMAAPTESRESLEWKKGEKLAYLQYLPEGYADTTASQPLVIFLHGSGERGTNLDLIKKYGPPKIAMNGYESWNPAYADPTLLAWMMLQSR